MQIFVTPTFSKFAKKVSPAQKKSLDKAVKSIAEKTKIGDEKVGDLAGILIFKFRVQDQTWLLAYRMLSPESIKLIMVGPHENFYRDIKRIS